MLGEISIDLGPLLPLAIEKTLSLLGKDDTTLDAKKRLELRARISLNEASFIQCIGMRAPVRIDRVVQETTFSLDQTGRIVRTLEAGDLASIKENIAVFGDPGSGKTVYLKRLYVELLQEEDLIPLYFPLRQRSCLEDIELIVRSLTSGLSISKREKRIVLLLDGYDEIASTDRLRIGELMRTFSALQCGFFVLTCRSHYDLVDLQAVRYWVRGFTASTALAYIKSLYKIYSASGNPGDLIDELSNSRFDDFLRSPLLLTLVCILRAESDERLPSTTIALIRNALHTLSVRWDNQRGVQRESHQSFASIDRMRVLKKVAFSFQSSTGPEMIAVEVAQRHLDMCGIYGLGPLDLLTEMAQWYGVLVPSSNECWTFTHKTIYDYLKADYWVHSGNFNPSQLKRRDCWHDPAVAYAACISGDATVAICKSLAVDNLSLITLIECLRNKAKFDELKVSKSLIQHLDRQFTGGFVSKYEDAASVSIMYLEFMKMASDAFLTTLIEVTDYPRGIGANTVFFNALHEANCRKLSVEDLITFRRTPCRVTIQSKPHLEFDFPLTKV